MFVLLRIVRTTYATSVDLVTGALVAVIIYILRSMATPIRRIYTTSHPNSSKELEEGSTTPSKSTGFCVSRISRTMRTEEVVLCLVQHGCDDITSSIDMSRCDQIPFVRGGFGSVYKGMLKDGRMVAIKCIEALAYFEDSTESKAHLVRAARELYTWLKCRHPGVLQLLGLAQFRGQIALVSPLMMRGSLARSIFQYPSAYRLRLCVQITEALEYLHSKAIAHDDVKPDNIIMNSQGQAQLADFGSAVLLNNASLAFTQTNSARFTTRYAAPELLSGTSVNNTLEADVYALGMTILFIITGKIPYPNKPDPAMMFEVTVKQNPPSRPTELDCFLLTQVARDSLWALLLRCWAYDPQRRPTPLEVKKELLRIQQDESAGSQ